MKKIAHYLMRLVVVTGCIFGGSSLTWAAEAATVTIDYLSVDQLNAQEHAQFIQGRPQEVVSFDNEQYLFIYQKDSATGSINQTPNNQALNKNTAQKQLNHLPNTGTEKMDHWVMLEGVALLFIGSLLFAWKRKQLKQMLMIFFLISSLSVTATKESFAEGRSVLRPTETKMYQKGAQFAETPRTITAYTYVGYLLTGKNDEAPKPVPAIKGQIEVHYQTISGEELAAPFLLEGTIGDNYQVEAKSFGNYVLKEVHGLAAGTFTKEKQVVTFIYEALAAPVTIYYVDEQGKEIHPANVITGIIGQAYDATDPLYKLMLEGYALDENQLPINATGTFTNQAQTVTFVYRKIPQKAKLIVRFVDRNTIAPFVVPDFSTLHEGDYVSRYPNLNQYTVRMLLPINGQTYEYQQRQTMQALVINTNIGEEYDLPEQIRWQIYDEKGQLVPQLLAPVSDSEGAMSGVCYWYNPEIPSNHSGIIDSKEVVVTYMLAGYGAYIPD